MKNKLILILLSIALFIPSIIAIAYYGYMTATPVEQREFSRVEITGADEKTFILERGNDKTVNTTLDFIINMNKNAQQIDYEPEWTDEYKLDFVYYNYSEAHEFDYYFVMSEVEDVMSVSAGYYKNDKGEIYKLAEADVKEFVATTYARSLYSGIDMPRLLLSGSDDPVKAQDVKWTFREVGGKYVNYDTSYDVTNDVQTYEIAKDFGMNFTVQPDVFTIKMTQDDAVLYDGDYASLVRSLDMDEEKPVSFEITAKWSESLSNRYAGEITYRFDANLIPSPIFTFTTADYKDGIFYVERGSVMLVTGKNIKDPSTITFTSSIDLGYEPTWLAEPETGTVYAFIPIPAELEIADNEQITFTVTSGGTKMDWIGTGKSEALSVLSDVNEAHFESEMQTILSTLDAPTDGTNYFNGAFASPVPRVDPSYRGFVRKADGAYMHTGVDIKDVSSDDTVHAGAGGTVVYVGELSKGESVVVIDHGLGVRSWYVNLDVNGGVIVGNTVEAGDVLGNCLDSANLHCSVTVFNKLVSPYKFWAVNYHGYAYPEFLNLK